MTDIKMGTDDFGGPKRKCPPNMGEGEFEPL